MGQGEAYETHARERLWLMWCARKPIIAIASYQGRAALELGSYHSINTLARASSISRKSRPTLAVVGCISL